MSALRQLIDQPQRKPVDQTYKIYLFFVSFSQSITSEYLSLVSLIYFIGEFIQSVFKLSD